VRGAEGIIIGLAEQLSYTSMGRMPRRSGALATDDQRKRDCGPTRGARCIDTTWPTQASAPGARRWRDPRAREAGYGLCLVAAATMLELAPMAKPLSNTCRRGRT
jgi:hypothetical protein